MAMAMAMAMAIKGDGGRSVAAFLMAPLKIHLDSSSILLA